MKLRTRWALRIVAVAILIPVSFVFVRWVTGNFGTVVPGRMR